MYLHSKILRNIVVCSLLFVNASQLFGQQAIVNTIVTPPYDAYFDQLKNQINVVVTNTSNQDPLSGAFLKLYIEGDNGIIIQTIEENAAFDAFDIDELETVTRSGISGHFDQVFQLNNLNITGISTDVLSSKGLPIGNYSVCFRLFNNDFGPASPEAPSGCFMFNNSVEPPQLVNPFCDAEITTGNNNVVFSWTTPPGAFSSTLEYTLKMIELLPNQDPNQAFLSSTVPAFFEKTVAVQTSILYGPTDPPLESGKTYAWQIIAKDDELDTPFLNNGRSEVCWFTWKPAEITILPIITTDDKEDDDIKPFFSITPHQTPVSSLTGKLLYKFKGAGTTTAGSISISNANVTTSNTFVDPNPITISANPNINRLNPKPQIPKNDFPVSTNGAKPLAGVSVSLVVTHLLNGSDNYGSYKFEPVSDSQTGYMSEDNAAFQDQVLATTVTQADGSFSFTNFINPHEDYGLVEEDIDAKQSSDVANLWMKGDVYKVLRLKVNNQYYLSPDLNITINPWESKDVGTLVSLVKSYTLKIKPKWLNSAMDVQGEAGATLAKVKLNVARTHIPNFVPDNEGNRENINSRTVYTVVGTAESTADGAIIKNLVQHNPSDSKDRYRIMTTPSEEAFVTYEMHNKSFKPKDGTSKFPYVSTTQGQNSGSYIGYTLGSNITWNHELVIEEYETTIHLMPKKPRITGVVQTIEDKLKNEWVILFNDNQKPNSSIKYIEKTKTDYQGRYRFDNLPMEYGDYDSANQLTKVIGPIRTLFTVPKGFKGQSGDVGILKWGSQFPYEFNLEPDGFFKGYVVDDEGNSVKAHINVDGLAMKETSFGFINLGSSNSNSGTYSVVNGTYKEKFAFKAPSGKRKVIVKAAGDNANNYSIYEDEINIPKTSSGNSEAIKIVLNKKKKRIRFKVVEYNTTTPIVGAKVMLKDISGYETPKKTDTDGYVEFVFENVAPSFSFEIEPPSSQEDSYTIETYDLPNVENTAEFTIAEDAYLKKTAKINGVVTIEGQLLDDAKVFFQIGTEQIEAQTNQQGEYTLNGIDQDIGTIQLSASKPGVMPNIISETKEITINSEVINTVSFDLKYDKEVSMSSIFGFDVEIIEKEKQNNGSYKIIEGNLINIPSNNSFKLRDNNIVLPFANVIIEKNGANDSNGTPIFEPIENFILLNDKHLDLKLNDAFNVVLGDASEQLKVLKNNNKGQIKGKVAIESNSFNTSNITLENDIFLTTAEGSSEMNITALGIDNPDVGSFGVVNYEGEEFTFKLGQFDAIAKQDKSNVTTNKITLYTLLKTQEIVGLTPNKLEVEAGDLVIQPDKIIPISNSNPIKFKLEDWNFESENWIFNTQTIRLEMDKGLIKTGSIDVPVNNITLSSSEFDIEGFDLNELTLGGIAKLDVIGNTASFGLNKNVGSDNGAHWELRITGENNDPAAQLKLPGFAAGKSIKFRKVSLLSNGEQSTAIQNNDYTKFYNIIDVKPTNVTSGDGYIDVTSMTDLGIPKIPESAGFIRFSKENGKIIAQVAPVPFTLEALGKVKLSVGNKPENTEIREGFFKAIGTLTDEEGINLQASIQKTNSETLIEVESGQSMQLGGPNTSFKDIEGKIELDNNNNWKKFTFSGELSGFKGVTPGQRQTFIVHGGITADNESVDVDNIETPFGDLALTYDIKKARFLGHLNIDQPIGGMRFVGAADMLMGADGWYFMAGGKGTPPGIGEISVGMIIGDSDYLAPNVTANLMQFAYDKKVPPSISNGVSGLFVTGQKVLPVINIPDWNVDLGVVSAKLGAKAGLDARIWMDFDKGGDIYGIGAMAFAHVYFTASSITCTHFSADARAELGIKGDYNTSSRTFSLDGCGSITVGGRFEQCFPVPFAGCEGCIGKSISKGVRLDLHLDSSGNTDMSFGFGGNCSGLTSGW